jgi:hypothetical protein
MQSLSQKVLWIVELYTNPPPNYTAVCVDNRDLRGLQVAGQLKAPWLPVPFTPAHLTGPKPFAQARRLR